MNIHDIGIGFNIQDLDAIIMIRLPGVRSCKYKSGSSRRSIFLEVCASKYWNCHYLLPGRGFRKITKLLVCKGVTREIPTHHFHDTKKSSLAFPQVGSPPQLSSGAGVGTPQEWMTDICWTSRESQDQILPSRLSVETTTVHLPTWRSKKFRSHQLVLIAKTWSKVLSQRFKSD